MARNWLLSVNDHQLLIMEWTCPDSLNLESSNIRTKKRSASRRRSWLHFGMTWKRATWDLARRRLYILPQEFIANTSAASDFSSPVKKVYQTPIVFNSQVTIASYFRQLSANHCRYSLLLSTLVSHSSVTYTSVSRPEQQD
jgi:hypothetical protein